MTFLEQVDLSAEEQDERRGGSRMEMVPKMGAADYCDV